MACGGVSWFVTCDAKAVTVQVSAPTKSVSGSNVNVTAPPELATVWDPLDVQSIENQLPTTLTAWLKVIVMLVFSATPTEPLAGAVAITAGGALHPLTELRFCGTLGVTSAKSALLLSVSVE